MQKRAGALRRLRLVVGITVVAFFARADSGDAAMVLTAGDRERRVEVNAGTVVTVRLPEEPTTGYRWTIEVVDGLEPVGDRVEPAEAIGGAGTRELQFRATRRGTHKLRLKKWREWEGEASAIDRFAVTIVVK